MEDPVRKSSRVEAQRVLARPLPGFRGNRGHFGAELVPHLHGDVGGGLSVYVIVVSSATSSSFGDTVSGSAARPATASLRRRRRHRSTPPPA